MAEPDRTARRRRRPAAGRAARRPSPPSAAALDAIVADPHTTNAALDPRPDADGKPVVRRYDLP